MNKIVSAIFKRRRFYIFTPNDLPLTLKKLLSIITTGIMTMSLFAGMTFYANAETVDYSGQASTGNYYISTAAQLNSLATAVNAGNNYSGSTFTLNEDISLAGVTWVPIGNSSTNHFDGTFDGGNHTISGISYSSSTATHVGFFGCIGSEGVVKNLTLSSGSIIGYRSVGAIAGKNFGSVENCDNTGVSVSSSGAKGVGGIVGANWTETTTSAKPVIKNCLNSGTAIYSAWVAGADGYPAF